MQECPTGKENEQGLQLPDDVLKEMRDNDATHNIRMVGVPNCMFCSGIGEYHSGACAQNNSRPQDAVLAFLARKKKLAAAKGATPAELAEAEIPLVFVPTFDFARGFEGWRRSVSECVATGLDRQAALKAMTLEPAALLGLEEQLGSLEAGKAANMVFLDGDPFEARTRVKAVMLEGEIVHGDVNE